jgi:hypothetical protein
VKRPILYLFIAGMFCDGMGTIFYMTRYGMAFEYNPFVKTLAMSLGPVTGTFIGLALKAVVVVILAAWLRRFSTTIFTLCGSISFLAGLYNFLMVELYIRDIVTWIPI